MNEKTKWRLHKINKFLDSPKAIIATLVILFVYFVYSNHQYQANYRQLLVEAKNAAQTTQTIVSKQDKTLAAIKQLAIDNRLLSDQKTNIIICMLQVPVNDRTTDIVTSCRKQVIEGQGADNSSGPTVQTSPSGTVQSPTNSSSSQSSQSVTPTPNPSPTGGTTPARVDPVLPNCKIDILGIHLGC